MICCYDLFLAWFCSYDFDMVSAVAQNCDFDVGQKCDLCACVFLLGGALIFSNMSWTHIKIISTSYQNSRNRPKACPGCFRFWFRIQPIGNSEKDAPFPHHIKTISNLYPKPYRNHNPNHIQFITKPCRNHNFKFKTYQIQIHILESYQHHITIIQTHIPELGFLGILIL